MTLPRDSWFHHGREGGSLDPRHLTDLEQGFILGVLMGGEPGRACLDRLAGASAARCRSACEALGRLPPATRRSRIRELGLRVFSPLPANVHRVHPSWVRHLLEREPPLLAAAVSAQLPAALSLGADAAPAGAPSLPPHRARLVCRAVLAPLAPMPPAQPDRPLTALSDPAVWERARLERALTHLGCIVLAGALRAAGPTPRPPPSRSLPPPLSRSVDRALAALDRLPRAVAHPPAARGRGAPADLLAGLGARLLAPALPALAARQMGQLLPRPLGLALRRAAPAEEEADAVLGWLQTADGWADEERPR